MLDVLNFGFAWLAVILTLVLSIIYITRKIAKSRSDKKSFAKSLNRTLRKPHKTIGALLIMAGLVHGLASSQTVWSINYGTVCWIISILLGLNWLFRDQLKRIGGWLVYHRIVTVIFIFSIVWHIVDVGGIQVFDVIANSSKSQNAVIAEDEQENQTEFLTPKPSPSASASVMPTASASNSPAVSSTQQGQSSASASDFQFDGVALKDGTYTGSADAYGPGLTVSVTVENGKVTSVEIVSHNEKNARYYQAPIQVIPEEIVQNQTLNVDIVSGATFTSIGIKNAVIDALSAAVLSGQLPDQESLPSMRKH